MPVMQAPNRELWLWLLHDGGAWEVADLAKTLEREPTELFWQLSNMAKNGAVQKLEPLPNSRRLRYIVSGTCKVPAGMYVAEVQAEPPDDVFRSAPIAETSPRFVSQEIH